MIFRETKYEKNYIIKKYFLCKNVIIQYQYILDKYEMGNEVI